MRVAVAGGKKPLEGLERECLIKTNCLDGYAESGYEGCDGQSRRPSKRPRT